MNSRLGMVVILVVAIVLPLVLNSPFYRDLLVMSLIFALLALSLDVIMGGMGQFSFGHAAFFGLGGYASALLTLRLGVPVWVGFVAAMMVGGVCGLLLGLASLRRTRGISLAIVTMGLGLIAMTLMQNASGISGGMAGLILIPKAAIGSFEFSSELSYYYLALVMVIAVMYFLHRMWRCRLGRGVIAVRENEQLARSIGIPAYRYYVIAFAVSTALAGLAGANYAHYTGFLNPRDMGFTNMLLVLGMVLVGGRGTFGGPILGALVFVFLQKVLPVSPDLRLVVFGAVLFVFIVFAPRGIYWYLESGWRRVVGSLRPQKVSVVGRSDGDGAAAGDSRLEQGL